MRGNRRTLFAAAALALAAALMLGIWHFTKLQTQEGTKTVVIEVVHSDKRTQDFTCRTDAEYLGQLLLEEELVEGEQSAYGLFITVVDGETAQSSLNQWWCITKGGETVNTGADSTPVFDGDHFELTLSTY